METFVWNEMFLERNVFDVGPDRALVFNYIDAVYLIGNEPTDLIGSVILFEVLLLKQIAPFCKRGLSNRGLSNLFFIFLMRGYLSDFKIRNLKGLGLIDNWHCSDKFLL